MSIFGDLERFLADLYPYRWPITAGLVLIFAVAAVFAYRKGWHLAAWRHRLATGLIAAVLIAAAVPAGDYLLSPLWERSHLEEASPLAMAMDMDGASPGGAPAAPTSTLDTTGTTSPTGDAPASPVPTAAPAPTFVPRVTHQGEFTGADDFHFGRGKALLIETEPGRYTLRFEEFSVRNGPDLFVFLSPTADGGREGALNLGSLKATDGAFNYDVPAGTVIPQFKSAIVWCEQFSVLFAVAPLVQT